MLSTLNHAIFFCVGRVALAVFCLHYLLPHVGNIGTISKKVQVGKDQEKAQSEKDSHSKNRGGKKPN